jgi:acetyltransferase
MALEAHEVVTLRDGSRVRLRPVAPDDAARLQDLVDHMSLTDVRHRFFAPIRQLSPQLSWHLSHPDPVREVAIAAVPIDGETILGVARLAADEAGQRAEYALSVRTDMKGHGLGYLMLGRLIDHGRAHGFREIWGDVMRDNDAMLLMAREHGFKVVEHPAEADLLRVSKVLEPRDVSGNPSA